LAAFLVVNLILFAFLAYLPLWQIPWAILFGFLTFDSLMDTVIGGGKGIFLIRRKAIGGYVFWKQHTLTKGHAFIALFLTILGVTFLSTAVSDVVVSVVSDGFNSSLLLGIGWGLFWNLTATAYLYRSLKKGFFSKTQ
jgi:hypothetical protein